MFHVFGLEFKNKLQTCLKTGRNDSKQFKIQKIETDMPSYLGISREL